MSDDADFGRFWESYPKKRSKGDAFKAWRVTKEKRPPIANLLKALAVIKASDDWRKDGGQYIPYPATWLRAWGWEDVPEIELTAVRADGKVWWQSVSGIEAKAQELGMECWNGLYCGAPESWQQWAARVRRAGGANVVQIRDKKLESAGG